MARAFRVLSLCALAAQADPLDGAPGGCQGDSCAALQAEPEAEPMHLVQLRARPQETRPKVLPAGAVRAALAEARHLDIELEDFWVKKNGDTLSSGSSIHTAPSDLSVPPSWSWTTHGLVRAAPLIDAKKNVYQATISDGILKFDKDGNLLWQVKKGTIPVVPTLYDGMIIAANEAGHIFALEMETGNVVWETKGCDSIGGDTEAVSAAAGTVVLGVCKSSIAGGNSVVLALDAKDGTEKWRFKPFEIVYNFLSSVHDNKLVFADARGHVYVLNYNTGELIWGRLSNHYVEEAGFGTGGAVMGPNKVIYVTANVRETRNYIGQTPDVWHGRIVAFRLDDGWRLWEADVPCMANAGAAVGKLGNNGKGPLSVVFGCGENPDLFAPLAGKRSKTGSVYAFDAETGAPRWTYELPVWTGGSAAGDSLTRTCLPDSFSNPAIGGDGTVYIGFMDGGLYSIKEGKTPADLHVTTFASGNAFQGSPGLAKGLLAAAPCNGVHVWNSGS